MKQITDLASQLIKEESSAISPILPQDNLFVNKGWQCPICKRVYSPFTHMCMYCGNREVEITTLPSQASLIEDIFNSKFLSALL